MALKIRPPRDVDEGLRRRSAGGSRACVALEAVA
jgi:hypothetical protein